MGKGLRAIWAIRASAGANRILYYIKRIPLIGRLLPDAVYRSLPLKQVLGLLARFAVVLSGFVGKGLYVALLIALAKESGTAGLPVDAVWGRFLFVFLMLSFGVSVFLNAIVLEPKRDKYLMVKLMRVPATLYMRMNLTLRYLFFFIQYAVVLMAAASWLDAPTGRGLQLAVLVTGWRLAIEVLHLVVFDRSGVILVKRMGLTWSGIIAGIVLTLAPLILARDSAFEIGSVLFNGLVLAVVVVLAAGCARFLWRYSNYKAAVDAVTKQDEPLLDMGRMMRDSQVESVRVKEGDLVLEAGKGQAYSSLRGLRYLNALFHTRYRQVLLKPFQKRLMVLVVLLIGAGLLAAFHPTSSDAGLLLQEVKAIRLPLLIGMSFLLLGEQYVKSLFYNCDRSLLRYSFYRSRPAVLEHFRIRFGRLLRYNLQLTAVLVFGTALVLLVTGIPFTTDLLFLAAGCFGLSVYFTLHPLATYYFCQPYSTEMNVKNPFFLIISSIGSMVVVMLSLLVSTMAAFAAVIWLLTIVYLLLAFAGLARFGSRTFRLKG
ncbi:hypothetical protein [Gorillibacterium sp. CAU 1737]|uniref:hypothetical protein n=1 Tax=Gorillibacterium sp. CAU 1737 TaxID=3140362 RepID=UPI0032617864